MMWAVIQNFSFMILLIAAIISIIVNVAVDNDNREKGTDLLLKQSLSFILGWIEGLSILVLMIIYSIIVAAIDSQKEDKLRRLKEVTNLNKQVLY